MEPCPHCGLAIASPSLQRDHVICESPAMQDLFKRVARFAKSDAPVVITGETGSGKEVVARTVHLNSPRECQPFVAVNVAALPAELLESELFGHARGAFTGATQAKEGLFEAADRGTLFLDEIAELPLNLQAKLLRALQEGEIRRLGDIRAKRVDVRVICATHRRLSDLVGAGQFREDLFYRLRVLTLRVPPLRDRPKDILPLARAFLAAEGAQAKSFSPATEKLLLRHGWPGNVRELLNAAKYAAALSPGPVVEPDHLPEELTSLPSPVSAARPLRTLAEVEKDHVLSVVQACHGAVGEAAQILGIGRNTLWRKLQQYA